MRKYFRKIFAGQWFAECFSTKEKFIGCIDTVLVMCTCARLHADEWGMLYTFFAARFLVSYNSTACITSVSCYPHALQARWRIETGHRWPRTGQPCRLKNILFHQQSLCNEESWRFSMHIRNTLRRVGLMHLLLQWSTCSFNPLTQCNNTAENHVHCTPRIRHGRNIWFSIPSTRQTRENSIYWNKVLVKD